MTYITKGVCSREINLDVQNGVVKDVRFLGGCDGNLKAIGVLVKGKKAEEVIELLSGVQCGRRGTSCADQLSIALREITGTA